MIFLLLIYLLFLLGFIIFSIFGLYHLLKYSYEGDLCKVVMASYIIIVGMIILISLSLFSTLDWGGFHFNLNILGIKNFIKQ